ncbi:MAG: efflux RND transporter periplasmic adaptor subunit [Planctomycetes bacterium]|nr:efflux RND transporter periplasmic adaptor subunit [Planctomycetota bacterium]
MRVFVAMGQCLMPLATICLLSGCQKVAPAAAKAKLPEVFIASPTEEVITEVEEFTGRTMAVSTVEVRARVTGYLDSIQFTDGADVKQGDLLAEVDPRSYQAELDKAEAAAAQAAARLERMSRQLTRARKLIETKTISQEDFELAESDHREAIANLDAMVASKDAAALNLSFTKITAPIDGQISRRLVDPGNLIKADDTPLATIVSRNPIHAYFDVDERTVLRIRRLIQQGTIKSARDSETTVRIGLADEEGFPLEGVINFVDNQIEATTGTLRLRAVINNEQRFLSPGMFVRVQVPIGIPHPALLIREEALGSDQGQRFVYLVDDSSKIQYQRVKIGMARGNLRVIESGVKLTDKIVVTGLQRVRPGVEVTTKPYVLPGEPEVPPATAPAIVPAAAAEKAAESKPSETSKD